MNLVEITKRAIEMGEKQESKLNRHIINLRGFSAPKTRHFLNNLIQPESRYLEIGVYGGSTFISALYGNNPEYHVAIDNFSENTKPRDIFPELCKKHLKTPLNLIDEDCFSFNPLERGIKDINMYFYDGPNEYMDHYNAVFEYYDSLASEFVLMVDDWNWDRVKLGTRCALRKKKANILFEKELPATKNGDRENWWNGLYVAVCSK